MGTGAKGDPYNSYERTLIDKGALSIRVFRKKDPC
jgi:hypothetical protein